MTCRACERVVQRNERLFSRACQLAATNGGLMNEIDRLRTELAKAQGWTPPAGPPREPEPFHVRESDGPFDWSTAKVEKRNYSPDFAWRIFTADGRQIHELVPYPGADDEDGLPMVWEPLCFATKREAEAALAQRRNGGQPSLFPEEAA